MSASVSLVLEFKPC